MLFRSEDPDLVVSAILAAGRPLAALGGVTSRLFTQSHSVGAAALAVSWLAASVGVGWLAVGSHVANGA